MMSNGDVRRYDPRGPRASEKNLGRLSALFELFAARGVLGEFKVWYGQQQERPDYGGGLSGAEVVSWVRSRHPELLDDTERVMRS